MRTPILAATLLAATPLLAQDASPSRDVILDFILRELGAEQPGDPLALPGEAPTSGYAQAAPKERISQLESGFAAAEIEGVELTQVDCEGPRCTVEMRVQAERPDQAAAQLHAVEDWIARTSPCPYMIATEPVEAPRIRAAIDCRG